MSYVCSEHLVLYDDGFTKNSLLRNFLVVMWTKPGIKFHQLKGQGNSPGINVDNLLQTQNHEY